MLKAPGDGAFFVSRFPGKTATFDPAKKKFMTYQIILQAQQPGSGVSFYIMIGLMIVIFYFFMIRPQQKKAKDQKKFVEEIKKGDNVVTIGGAHGRVAEIEGDTFVLEFERGARIKFSKSSVSMDSTKAAYTEKKPVAGA
jgi:preprotein translocase subunit YajC